MCALQHSCAEQSVVRDYLAKSSFCFSCNDKRDFLAPRSASLQCTVATRENRVWKQITVNIRNTENNELHEAVPCGTTNTKHLVSLYGLIFFSNPSPSLAYYRFPHTLPVADSSDRPSLFQTPNRWRTPTNCGPGACCKQRCRRAARTWRTEGGGSVQEPIDNRNCCFSISVVRVACARLVQYRPTCKNQKIKSSSLFSSFSPSVLLLNSLNCFELV